MKIYIVTDWDDGGLAVCLTKERAEELLADVENIPYSKSGNEYYRIVERETDDWAEGFEG